MVTMVMMDLLSQRQPIGMMVVTKLPRRHMMMVEINNQQLLQLLLPVMVVIGEAQLPLIMEMANTHHRLPIGGKQLVPRIGGILQQRPILFPLQQLIQLQQHPLTTLILKQQ